MQRTESYFQWKDNAALCKQQTDVEAVIEAELLWLLPFCLPHPVHHVTDQIVNLTISCSLQSDWVSESASSSVLSAKS